MTIQVHWDGYDTSIIRWTVEGWWDWDDFEAAAEESRALRALVDHPVALIITIDDDAFGPEGLTHVRYALMLSPDNREMVVIATLHPHALHLLDTLCHLYPEVCDTLFVVASVDDAYAVIDRQRALLRSRAG